MEYQVSKVRYKYIETFTNAILRHFKCLSLQENTEIMEFLVLT